LVGPYTATLAITVVLLLQALLFADGGLTALGLSIFNMGLIGVWVGYFFFLLTQKIFSGRKSTVALAAAIGGFVSVPAAATGFVMQYAIGGTGTFSVTAVFTAMFGTHVLIGIGEAIITGLAVGAVIASRSDLVYGFKNKKVTLEIRKS
jgi:cobalamin biosynthesis protein CbiM